MIGTVEIMPGGNPRQTRKRLSVREALVLDLIKQGASSAGELAELVGTTPGNIRFILCKMRKKGVLVPHLGTGVPLYMEPITVVMTRDVAADLRRRAARKGTTASELLQRLILIVTKDDLFDAIIDER